MSIKDRITFAVAGTHPLLSLTKKYLISQGYALVPHSEVPDFCLYGAVLTDEDPKIQIPRLVVEFSALRTVPTLVLSSNKMYLDRNWDLTAREKSPMSEDSSCSIYSVLNPSSVGVLHTLFAETLFLTTRKSMVLRVFNVYGPSVNHGVIPHFLHLAKSKEPMEIHGTGYQSRAFLYEDDYLEAVDRAAKKLVRGSTGLYNVGHPVAVTIRELARSIWQFTNGLTPFEEKTITYDRRRNWWSEPDITRFRALARWSPKVSLRSGLKGMI